MGFNFKQEQKKTKTPTKIQTKQLSWGERIDQAKLQMAEERKPKPVKPATQGMGDFRQAESKMKPYKAPETSTNTAKEDRERFTKTLPQFLQKPVSKVNNFLTSLEESKGGKFYLRSGEKAANTAFLNNDEVKETTGNKKLDFAADLVGGIGGFINPQAPANVVFQGGTKIAEKGLGKIAPKLAQSKLATNIIGGAGAGAATGTAEGIIEGKNAKDTAKLAGKRAGEFAAVGAVGHAVGKLAEKGLGKLGEVLSKKNKFNTTNSKQFLEDVNNAYGTSKRTANKSLEGPILPLKSPKSASKIINPNLVGTTIDKTNLPRLNAPMPKTRAISLEEEVLSNGFKEVNPETIAKTYNKKTWYHGTGTPNLKSTMLDPFAGDHQGLFGHGIYLTDTPEIAKGYANARSKRTKTPTIYEANTNINKVVDLEKPITRDVQEAFKKGAYSDFRNVVDGAAKEPNATPESVFKALKEAVGEHSQAEGVPTSEYVEMFQDIATELKRSGYDGITHTGGLRTGKDPHKVLILLDPNDYYAGTGRANQVTRFDPNDSLLKDSKSIGKPLGDFPPILNTPTKILNESNPTLTLKENPLQIKPNVVGKNERQFAQSVINSQVATNDIKQGLKENKLTYEPITNKETFDKATQTVKSDPNKALEYFNSPSKGVNADDVAIGEALITKAIKEGNNNEANRLIADLAEKLTTAGQAVQAASIFKRLTPEGMLLYAQRMVNSINKEQLAKFGKQAKKAELTPEDATFILDTMKKAVKLPEGREKDIALGQINQLLANKSPASRSEKVKALQRISLLLNPRTMGRNIIGNTIFGALDNISNTLATPIDMLTGKLTGKRTATLPSLTGQLKSAKRAIGETIEDARLGINTYNTGTQYELPNKQIFKGDDLTNKVLNKLDQATRVGLEFGDRPFFQAAKDDVLRQQMKLANVKEPTQEMIEQAHKIAEQRTYQDINGLTKAFKWAQKALNAASENFGIGTKDFGLGNIVLPFVKTPANILSRALEYSPVGITKAFKEALKRNGTFDQRTFVDSIARSVTGTAIILVGYDLAKKGIITGSFSKDKDKAQFERSIGKNDFAFKVGDKYYTYDWAQPASMGLAIGADVFLRGQERKDAENVVVDAINSGGETLFKQSLLQGLQRFMGGMNPIDSMEATAVNAPSQFIPTLSGQINQLTDPVQRNTFSPNIIGTGYNLIKGKIPGASQTLEPKIDTFGNTVMRNQGNVNLFDTFLNPGETTKYKPNKLQKEILRLYDATGNKDVFPKVAPKYFKAGGERYDLTPKEQTKFQQTMGKRTEQLMNETKFEPFMTDELRAKIFAKAIQDAYEEAKAELIKNR